MTERDRTLGGNSLSAICIRRPVFATVMSLLLVLLGVVSFDRLSVREYPNIDPPIVLVTTTYPGASAEVIESQVSRVLEEVLAGIEGVEFIRSISRQERSMIAINFGLNRDPDAATSDVRDRAGRVAGRLPEEADEPVILRLEADSDPIMWLAFSSDHHNIMEISDFADRFAKDRLQSLPGVAEARLFGERLYAMRIWLDPARLAAYELTAQDVESALRQQNVEIPAGRIESADVEFTVLSETDLRVPDEFAAIILRENDGYLVRLRDVGRVEIAPRDERSIIRFNQEPAVGLGIVKQSTGNPLEIARAVREEIPRIEESLPDGMRLRISYDSSIFIERSIDAVYQTIFEAVVLVGLVVFLFLRTPRATLIPMVTIPASLMAAFAIMAMLGFTINTLTLLAMVLAIGLVVDDAIVMLENIFRHIEEGMEPVAAALKGSREIGFAVIAMTLTLATVYAPIGFLTGRSGKLFIEFAWSLAGAVLVSGFVALTLTPMMCSRLLRHEEKHGRLYVAIETGLEALISGYRKLLERILDRRIIVILSALVFVGLGGVLFTLLKTELAPSEDRGTIVGVFRGPEDATIDYMDRGAAGTEAVYATTPEVKTFFLAGGDPVVNQGVTFINLHPWEERERSQFEVVAEMGGRLAQIPGILAFPTNRPSLGQSPRSRPVWIVLLSSADYGTLEAMVAEIMEEARKYPGFINLDTNLKLNKPELKVTIDRDKAKDAGIDVAEISRTLETMLGGRQVTRFKRGGKQYDVVVQLADFERTNPEDMGKIYVRGKNGDMIQLSSLVSVTESVAPRELVRFNQMRSAEINSNLAPGYTLGEALAHLEGIVREKYPDIQIDYMSQSREFKESSTEIYFVFVLALIFIYLVLSAQFESFVDPLVILLTVPLSLTGALATLNLFGGTLNIYSQIGLVTLVGLITKHGILIVEFSNQLRNSGVPLREAVIEAAALRLRPILMTSGAMVMGAVPLVLSTGAGAESRYQIGLVIVGGILVGTVLTLFVLPTAYALITGYRDRRPGSQSDAETAVADTPNTGISRSPGE